MGALWIPGRHGFCKLIFGDSFWSPIRVVHYIQSVEYGECQFLPIWRRYGITNLVGQLVRAVFDGVVEVQARAHGYVDVCLERDLCGCSAIYRHLPDFASIGCHYKLAVWCKGHRREYALRGDGLLLVTLYRVGQPFFIPILEVADDEACFVLVSGTIDHPVAILTQGRGESGAVAGRDAGDFSFVKIVVTDLILWKKRIVIPSARSPREVHLFAIRAYKRIDGLHGSWGIVELYASTSIDVVHPQFGYSSAFGYHDVVPVWSPVCTWHIPVFVLGYLHRVFFD